MITIKKLSELATDFSLRNDAKFVISQTSFAERIDFLQYKYFENLNHHIQVNVSDLDLQNVNYCEISNIEKNGDIEPYQIEENAIIVGSDEERILSKIKNGDIIKIKSGNILLSSVRPNLKKVTYISQEKENTYFTKALITINPINNNKLFYYLLRTNLLTEQIISIARTGKSYPTITKQDLLRFLNVPKNIFTTNNELLTKVEKLENQIFVLQNTKQKQKDIINRIFEKEFGFSTSEFFEQKNANYYVSSLYQNATSFDLRTSRKFHSPTYKLLDTILHKIGSRKIKSILAKDIRLGASISPQHYDEENGTALYVSMKAIKNRVFEVDNCTKVTDEYWENNKKYDSLQIGDILIARSGEGTIGKAAMINEDVQAIFCDFIMRVRLNKENNPLFVTHYFNSDLFQFLVERDKKGLGNNTNIFPSQIKEFFIPSISLHRQINIAEEIQAEIDSQNNIDTEIAAKRKAIEEIVLSVML